MGSSEIVSRLVARIETSIFPRLRQIEFDTVQRLTFEKWALFAFCCLPSTVVYVFVEPQWHDDGVWMMLAHYTSLIPLNEPAYLMLVFFTRNLFGGLTDSTVAAVLLVQHVLFSLSLYTFASFFQKFSSRLIAAFLVVFPGSMLWIVNGIYKQGLGISFVLLSVACVLRVAGREYSRSGHWIGLFFSLYLAIITRYPSAILLGLAPLAFLLRFARERRFSALKPFVQSLALSAGVMAAVSGTFVLANLEAGNPPFLVTSGMFVPFKLASFEPSEEELDILTRSAMASVEDPEVKAVIPLIGRSELLDVPGGMVGAIDRTIRHRFHRELEGKEADRLMSLAGQAVLSTSAYWREVWDPRSVFAHLFSDGRITAVVGSSNAATRSFLAGDNRDFLGRVMAPIGSLSEASMRRNTQSLTSWIASLWQLRWYYDYSRPFRSSEMYYARHLDLRLFYYLLAILVLFLARPPFHSPVTRSNLAAPQIAIALGALSYVTIMGTIHIFTIQYSTTFVLLVRTVIASQAAMIDWRAAAVRVVDGLHHENGESDDRRIPDAVRNV